MDLRSRVSRGFCLCFRCDGKDEKKKVQDSFFVHDCDIRQFSSREDDDVVGVCWSRWPSASWQSAPLMNVYSISSDESIRWLIKGRKLKSLLQKRKNFPSSSKFKLSQISHLIKASHLQLHRVSTHFLCEKCVQFWILKDLFYLSNWLSWCFCGLMGRVNGGVQHFISARELGEAKWSWESRWPI